MLAPRCSLFNMPRGTRSARPAQPAPSPLSPQTSPVAPHTAPRPQSKKRTVAENAKAIDTIYTKLDTMSSLLFQVVGQLNIPSSPPAASDSDTDHVVESAPSRSTYTRTTHRSDFAHIDSQSLSCQRHNSVNSSHASGSGLPHAHQAHRLWTPYSRTPAPDPLSVRATHPPRRDLPATLQELVESADLQHRVAHLVAANLVPPHLSGKKSFAHSYVRRGARKSKTTLGDLTFAE